MISRALTFCLLIISLKAFSQNQHNYSIDHISIVVNNLDEAAENFKMLGFSIKPGSKHTNSIENAHIKFKDGSALELIMAKEPKDQLARKYLDEMMVGDGPVFLCLGMDNPKQTKEVLIDFNPSLTKGSYYQWLTFPGESDLSYLFLMNYTNPPMDKKEHLNHKNGASGVESVALGKQSFEQEKSLFTSLGLDVSSRWIELGKGKILLNTSTKRDRPIVSIALKVKDLEHLKAKLPNNISYKLSDDSLTIPRNFCHGVELVFKERE